MEIFCDLPKDILLKIYHYAIPKLDEKLKRSIEVTSAHMHIKRIHNRWNIPYFDENGERVYPPFSWNQTLFENTTYEKREQLFMSLSKCGCCVRHSNGVVSSSHCTDIVGSHTSYKYQKKYTTCGKLCNCWCRMQMRIIKNINDDFIE